MIGSDTIKIKGGNAIVFSETEDSSLLTTALLTTGDKAFLTEDGDRGAYVLGAAAETAEGARLVWFTGEKNYLLTMADITVDSEESLFYPTFCPYLGMMWTTLNYTSGVAELPAVLYEEPYLDASGMEFIVFGLVFVLAIPAGLIATGLVKSYKRKKA